MAMTNLALTSAIVCCFGIASGANLGHWGPAIQLPLVPAAAAVQPNGRLLTWSAYSPNTFQVAKSGMTKTAEYDPATDAVTSFSVVNTNHDMFCPGISIDWNGRVVVTGGDTANRTSIYVPNGATLNNTSGWIIGGTMNIPRGYQSSATISDGRIFTIGGSWSGGYGNKNGEIFNPATNTWTRLPSALVAPLLTNDAQGIFRQDNHAWLYSWKNGNVLQAGPSKNMNWYGTSGSGSTAPAGRRGTDNDAMCAVTAMYDAVAGKIFSAGGSPSYQQSTATRNAQVLTIGATNANVTVNTINPMWFARAFANAVILPDGKVFIVGGQTYAVPFSDGNSSLTPEVWDPVTTKFVKWATGPTPRNYHSVALLMPNGTIFSGGGGLCGDSCTTNHEDGQLFSPPYLFNSDGVTLATRPVIASVSSKTPKVGGSYSITLGAKPTSTPSFSMIRIGSNTHTVNTDQRRVPLSNPTVSADGLTYTFTLPSDTGVILPGYWYTFAIVNGVPSVATIVQVVSS
ncbi:copper radical oxidase [Myriangium duriaei CBS 260.36]|uniref:Copper radical oxidase n=1 Tax=Myriangium duriaei CBS 260.36 TaxID=1168546 RepID=A0A9P4MKM6_9PEZI|nr:copper radical oxidase [Myriangium duriaei CBS 260.36]